MVENTWIHPQGVQVNRNGGIVTLRLVQPETGNALTTELLKGLSDALRNVADGARVLVLSAVGRDFSVGRPPLSYSDSLSDLQTAYEYVVDCNERLAMFPGITIAVVQGRAVGAGCSLACRCDIVLASETARFSFPELTKGVPPVIVAAYYSKRMPWRGFLDMVLTGREVAADEALRLGLVTRVVPDHTLETEAMTLAEQVAALDSQAVRVLKEFLQKIEVMTILDANRFALALLLDSLTSRQSRMQTGGGE